MADAEFGTMMVFLIQGRGDMGPGLGRKHHRTPDDGGPRSGVLIQEHMR